MKIGLIDFKQPSTWRGIAGFAALFGLSASPEFTNAICIALGAVLSAIEIGRNEYFGKLSNNARPHDVNRRESAESADAALPAFPVAAEPLRPPLPPANDPTDFPPDPGFSNR